MRLFSAVALVLSLPAITACSGLPGTAQGGPAPLFHTHINEEGSKRFTFEAAPLDDGEAPPSLRLRCDGVTGE